MRFSITIFLITFMGSLFAGEPKGSLVIIGGGERPADLMKEIVDLAGGTNAEIMIIPSASSDPEDVGQYQSNQFMTFKPKSADFIIIDKKKVNSDLLIGRFKNITGIFFSGGDQRKLTDLLLGSKLLERIKEIYAEGGVIAGTSAGAAVMSKIMITGDELIHPDSKRAFGYIQRNNIATSEGFGFIDNAIIDQHFIYRKRHNRLISLVLENPNLLGIGIDESTALKVSPDGIIEIIGEYQVIIYDAGQATMRNDFGKGLLSAHSITMHVLAPGDRYNLNIRKIIE